MECFEQVFDTGVRHRCSTQVFTTLSPCLHAAHDVMLNAIHHRSNIGYRSRQSDALAGFVPTGEVIDVVVVGSSFVGVVIILRQTKINIVPRQTSVNIVISVQWSI